MTVEESKKYAKTMSYHEAIYNLMKARSVPYKKATFIKINELLDIVEPQKSENKESINEINCPHDLNQFLLGEPKFGDIFPEEECEQRKFYGDCFHCFSTAIANRDKQLKNTINKIIEIVDEWKLNTQTYNLSCDAECMVKIAELVELQKSEED